MRVSNRYRHAPALALAALAVFGAWYSLPTPLFRDPFSTILLTRDGILLGARIAEDGQWRFPPATSVPVKFQHAIIAYEDKRFHWHLGVDPFAIARAVRLNWQNKRVVSGASTLSMQVVRLARDARNRGYVDKVVEALLAVRLELQYSKKDIVELYAAHAPFGGNVVGLEAAAWRYFGRAPEQLSWAETCTLAVLPNSPSLIHPGRNRQRLKEKRNQLLHRLHTDGHFSSLDLELALLEPLPQEPVPLPQDAPHLLETLRAESPGMHRIQTTLNATLQRSATEVVQARAEDLARQGIHNAAAVIFDNHSFEVLAYVGNAKWSVSNEHGFAVDVIRRPRSSGSILKPMLYATMLDAGEILPRMLVTDVPTQYGGYIPENFDHGYRGAVPADVALAQSLNVPAVRMLRQHGVNRFYDFLRHAGLSTLTRGPDDYGLTLILGGAEVTLWETAILYANLAHIARAIAPDARPMYRQARVTSGKARAEAREAEISPGAAWLTLQALLEVARPSEEGHWRSFASSRKIAWKTGTSWGLRDAWALGVSSRFTVGVWAGNATGEGRAGLTGASAAAPILFDLFNRLETAEWFTRPDLQLKEVETCQNDGYLANSLCDTQWEWVPRDSHFEQASPHNVRVHLDNVGRHRVHGECERVTKMQHANWFVLPPAEEFYYRRQNGNYRVPPPWRGDCRVQEARRYGKGPIEFLYPNVGARIYIPTDLAEKKSRTVFEAVHRERDSALYWHLDEHYLGVTHTFHQRALNVAPGLHTITVVDQEGNRLSRQFEVLELPRR